MVFPFILEVPTGVYCPAQWSSCCKLLFPYEIFDLKVKVFLKFKLREIVNLSPLIVQIILCLTKLLVKDSLSLEVLIKSSV